MARARGYNSTVPYYATNTNISVPSRIKCCRCDVVKNPHAFARNRLEDLRLKISRDRSFDAERQGHIPCSQCTGGQVTELFCNGCDKYKGLNSFAKAQRKIPDKAKCHKCMQEQLNTEPGASSSEGDSGSVGEASDSDESFEGGTTVAPVTNTLSNMSITNGTSTTGGVALESYNGSNNSSTVPLALRRGPASVNSSNTDTVGNNPNFAKIRAAPRRVQNAFAERERKRDQEDDDDVHVADSDDNDED